jgi:UDP-glucose-4-epimerase GalE
LKILVIGGAGYVGSHMVKHLVARKHSVTVFDNLSRGHADAVPAGLLHRGDLLAPQDLRAVLSKPFDAVMHFAAFCYVGESVQKPREYHRNNVVGSLNVLEAAVDAGIKSFVFSSTCATYGVPQESPISESHPQNPINPYGAGKLMVERMLKDYADSYGLNSVSLRYFNAAGSDPDGQIGERHDPETHLIPLTLMEALRVRNGGDPAATTLTVLGNDYDTPDGTCIRDYVHVDDLAAAHLAAAEQMASGKMQGARAFNLGTESGYSVLEVIASCRRVTGAPIQYKLAPRRPGDPSRLVANSDAARRALGWRPQYVELDRIVETAWRWFSSRPRKT